MPRPPRPESRPFLLLLPLLLIAALANGRPLRADEPTAHPSRTPTIPNETQQSLQPGPHIHVVRVPNPREPGPPGENQTSPNPASNPQVGLGIEIPLWGGGGGKSHHKKKARDEDDDDSDPSEAAAPAQR